MDIYMDFSGERTVLANTEYSDALLNDFHRCLTAYVIIAVPYGPGAWDW